MHITKIEEFSFDHGQHFNTATGEYHSLNPHTLGRPLTHTEMDYNLIYQKQTLNGFRICGSNNDLTLALSDLGARLEFTQISSSDADWPRFQAAGLFNGQFVWNPVGGALPVTTTTTAAPTTTTSTTTTTTAAPPATVIYHAHTQASWVVPPSNFTTTYNAIPTGGPYTIAGPTFGHSEGHVFSGWDTYSSMPMAPPQYQPGDTITLAPGSTTNFYARYDIPVYQNLTATPSPADEGQNIIINLSGINIPDGRTVGWTITGVDTNDISGSLTGTFTMNSNQAEYIITVTEDLVTEGTETLTLTCAADDNAGTDCGLSVAIDINDTSLTPTTTTTVAPTYTVTINAVTNPSNIVGSHPLVQSGLSAGNFTLPGPTWSVTGYTFLGYDTYSGAPMAPPTLQPGDVINITADVNLYARYTLTTTTTTAAPTTTTTTTTTAAPTYSLSVNGPVNEGGNMVFTLTTTGLQDGDVVPFGLSGTATIGVDYSDVNPKEFVIANNSATYTVTTFADNTTEGGGNETIKLTLAAFDSQGNGTFSETVTGEIVDTSQTPTTTTTTTSTTTSTTTAAPELAYFFHLGGGGYPYTQDLIGGTWYKADNSVAADFAEGFADALANPSSYEIIASVSSISNGDQFIFPASIAQNFYWLLIPDSYGIPDLTGVARLADTQNNINDVAAQVHVTTVNGQPYKLYRINLLAAANGVTIQYNV